MPHTEYRQSTMAESAGNPVVLVIGAAVMDGIGHACAVEAARAGNNVVLLDIERPSDMVPPIEAETGWSGLDSVAAEIRQQGRAAATVIGDVRSHADIDECLRLAREMGRLTGLVNSVRARLEPTCPSIAMDDSELTMAFDVNVRGALLSSGSVAREMSASGTRGSIVHISSIAGLNPLQGRTAYSVSKAALNMLTRTMALDLALSGIRVNAVCPGVISTNRVDPEERHRADEVGQSLTDYRRSVITAQGRLVPMGRVGRACEVAALVGFLLSDASSYLTGEVITVAGGLNRPPAPS
jgi:NAD(P)-dependent dehydrogenase (short-subunit alcohol dehydrogenase family)